jgi:hypothetical protein
MMTPPNHTRLALSIWWRSQCRAIRQGWPEAAPWVAFFVMMFAALLLMLASAFLLSPALGTLVACLFHQPLPELAGDDLQTLDLRFCREHMLAINGVGFALAFWALFWSRHLSKSEGAETFWGRIGEATLVAIPGGMAFCWLIPAALLIAAAHLPRWSILAVRWFIPWARGLGGRIRARQEQLIANHPELADEVLKKTMNRKTPEAGMSSRPAKRL